MHLLPRFIQSYCKSMLMMQKHQLYLERMHLTSNQVSKNKMFHYFRYYRMQIKFHYFSPILNASTASALFASCLLSSTIFKYFFNILALKNLLYFFMLSHCFLLPNDNSYSIFNTITSLCLHSFGIQCKLSNLLDLFARVKV